MNSYRKLAKNFLSICLGQFSSKLFTYIMLPLYTYILSPEEYGIYDLLNTTISLLIPVITIDIAEGCFRFALDKNIDKKQIFSIGCLLSILAIIFVIILFPVFSLIHEIKAYYLFFVFLFATNTFNSFLMQFVKGSQNIKFYSFCGVLHTVILLALNLVFLLGFKWKLSGYFLAYILSGSFVNIFIILKIRFWNYFVSFRKINKNVFREILKYTIPMIPNSICWWINNSSDKYMIKYYANISLLGIYSVSYKIPSIVNVVSGMFMNAWGISAIENFNTNESEKLYSNIYNGYFSFLIIVASFLIITAKPLAYLLYQNEFFSAWKCSIILLIGAIFNGLSSFLGTIYTAAKQTKMLFISTLIAAIINILLNWLFIPIYGIYGASIATMFSYMCIWIIRLFHSKRILQFKKHSFLHISSLLLLTILTICIFFEFKSSYIFMGIIFLCLVSLNIWSFIKNIKSKQSL